MLLFWLMGASELPRMGNVEWTELSYTEGCFFFAGPADLGRDEPLGYNAVVGPQEIRFGTFAFRQRSPGVFARASTHAFGGEWEVVQLLEGDWTGGAFSGRYSYVEQRKQGETGKECQITANVRIRS
jgi:hypothetical protein